MYYFDKSFSSFKITEKQLWAFDQCSSIFEKVNYVIIQFLFQFTRLRIRYLLCLSST